MQFTGQVQSPQLQSTKQSSLSLSTSDPSTSIYLKDQLFIKSLLYLPGGIFHAFPALEQAHKAHHFVQMELR